MQFEHIIGIRDSDIGPSLSRKSSDGARSVKVNSCLEIRVISQGILTSEESIGGLAICS